MATGTPATALLTRPRIAFTLHPYEHDPRAEAYGEEAAAALGVDPARIFKTLIAAVDGKLACAVVPVAGRLDLKAFAAALGGKRAELADPAAAARATGYVVGGISPIGQKTRLPVVVDESAAGFDTVFVSAGKRGLQVELARGPGAGHRGAGVCCNRRAVTGRSRPMARCELMTTRDLRVRPTDIEGLLVITVKQITDERGTVREFYRMSGFRCAERCPTSGRGSRSTSPKAGTGRFAACTAKR